MILTPTLCRVLEDFKKQIIDIKHAINRANNITELDTKREELATTKAQVSRVCNPEIFKNEEREKLERHISALRHEINYLEGPNSPFEDGAPDCVYDSYQQAVDALESFDRMAA